jgi:hypothetical protein
MSLEERVTRMMEQFVDARPPMRELLSGERDTETPLAAHDARLLIESQVLSCKRAIQFLAREIEKLQGA